MPVVRPVANGHVDMIEAACRLCDRLVLAMGVIMPARRRSSPPRSGPSCCARSAARSPPSSGRSSTSSPSTISPSMRARGRATILVRGLRDGTDLVRNAACRHEPPWFPELQTVFLRRPRPAPAHHRDAGPPDRLDGRRRLRLRSAPRSAARPGSASAERLMLIGCAFAARRCAYTLPFANSNVVSELT